MHGRLLTETLEVWDSSTCTVRFGTKTATVQVDSCSGLRLEYVQLAYFDRVMHTGPRGLAFSFSDAPQLDTTLELDALQAEHPDVELDDKTDQFITRCLKGADQLSTELVIRLCNDFPTTEREARDFEERTRMHAEKLDEVVDGMLGSSLGRTLTEAEREQARGICADGRGGGVWGCVGCVMGWVARGDGSVKGWEWGRSQKRGAVRRGGELCKWRC